MSDTYRTLAGPARAEIRREGSRFIAEAHPVAGAEAALAKVEAVRERERKATHHCWAYRLGPDRFRYDDDGEPSGTAGAPILQQIDGAGLRAVLVVVTRYYGGTKLGTGGLARAYSGAAAEALAAAPAQTRTHRTALRLVFAYDDTAPARRTLGRFDAVVQREQYTAQTHLVVGVRRSEVEAFQDAFTEALGGRGTVARAGESDQPDASA